MDTFYYHKINNLLFIFRHIYFIAFLLLLLILPNCTFSQDNPYKIDKYPFINYKTNSFTINDTIPYNLLFNKLTQIAFKGKGKVRIVHIGDSHLQADFLSGNFRRKLQTFFLGTMGGRGFVFPYKVAKTNNPLNYKVAWQGEWQSCRNVEKEKQCKLGLSGISVTTTNKNSSITIKIADPKLTGYDFDRLMVFHEFGEQAFEPALNKTNLVKTTVFPNKGYTLFEFKKSMESVTLNLKKTNTLQNSFSLYGFNFDSNDAGIIYHTIGVNGAQVESYLRCQYFVQHLAALQPDWVIVSLGTNDAYTDAFDTLAFKNHLNSIIGFIKQAAPHAAVLFTTPGDHRIGKVHINDNVQVASNIIIKTANRHKLSYWNFNQIMGGKGSINNWHYAGLAHTDYLHYSRKGYEYQAQLLFNAFLKSYDGFLEKQILLQK